MEFKSKILQKDGIIDATQLYKDIEDFIEKEKILKGTDRLHRHHPLQHILNSTSGNYVSPTSMKSFNLCPAGYLYGKLVTEKTGTATSVGRTYHTIMERFYNEKAEDRTIEKIYSIMEKVIKEDNQQESYDDVKAYVDGYLDAKDYLNNKPMDHNKLVCFNEVFIKPTINPLGVNLDIPIYTLLDRIDIREDGLYIVDYKTGFGDPNPYLLGENGYLPQMIFYKWAAEAEYGQEVKGAFLCLPGASEAYKYVPMNVNSLVEQSKVVEQVKNHIDFARSVRDSKQFPERYMRYCGSCQLKHNCEVYIKTKGLDETNIKECIDISIEVEDNYGENE